MGTITATPDLPEAVHVEPLLAPGERVLSETAATSRMAWAGTVAIGWAVVAFAVAFFPLRQVARHLPHLTAADRVPALLFGGFGLLWVLVAVRLLLEPRRLARSWPHIRHVLTDRRFLAIDARAGVIGETVLDDIWTMKTFSPFGRLTLRRSGFGTSTGRYVRVRDYDGVADVEALAQRIADMTGVPVGITRAGVAASIARMPPGTKVR